jgi:hypothetical protein
MRWPWSTKESQKEDINENPRPFPWFDNLDVAGWSEYAEARTVVPSLLLTVATLALIRVYKSYLRRIPSVNHIKPDLFRRRSLFGKVTSVGDADNFRLFHTPGGRLAGWGWLPWKIIPSKKEDLVAKTVGHCSERIKAGDCPSFEQALIDGVSDSYSNCWRRCT